MWVISCRGAVKVGRPLDPQKVPRESPIDKTAHRGN